MKSQDLFVFVAALAISTSVAAADKPAVDPDEVLVKASITRAADGNTTFLTKFKDNLKEYRLNCWQNTTTGTFLVQMRAPKGSWSEPFILSVLGAPFLYEACRP